MRFLPRTRLQNKWLNISVGVALAAAFSCATPQAKGETIEDSSKYLSQIDEDLTIRRVAVLPVTDNVDGIYARPIESEIIALVRDSHRWDYVESNVAGAMPTAVDMEEKPTEVDRVTSNIDADAFIVAVANRGPGGISIRLDLFLKKDNKLLVQEVLKDHPRFEIPELREQVKILFAHLVAKLPYEGLVLSRQGNRVTVNVGKSDGINKDQVITAIQIISVVRHPKFGFLVSSEKEILGKIKILKVDETLSFGAIVAEKERGAIHRFAKIAGITEVTYAEPENFEKAGLTPVVTDRADSQVSFGKDPKEWLPARPPSFGQVGLKIGIGTFSTSNDVSGVGSLSASSPYYPSVCLSGEMWLTSNWTIAADITQGVLSTSNPRAGSTPTNLNISLSRYNLSAAYNFLLRGDFFGPKLFINAGFTEYKMFVDDSTPEAFTSTAFSGVALGFGGSTPVTDNKLWYAGGHINLYLMPTLSETPTYSGSGASATMTEFSIEGQRKIAENLRATASLDFSMYSASFSGQGDRVGPSGSKESASSLSEKSTVLTGGLVYMF